MLAAAARAAARRGAALPTAAPTRAFAAAGGSTDVPPDAVAAASSAVADANTPASLTGVRPLDRGAPAGTPASREIKVGAQAFLGDLRASSALGTGDGLTAHTAKWLQSDAPAAGVTVSPADLIAACPPIKVHGAIVASTGVDGDPALGCPVEYIDVRGDGTFIFSACAVLLCFFVKKRGGGTRRRAPFFLTTPAKKKKPPTHSSAARQSTSPPSASTRACGTIRTIGNTRTEGRGSGGVCRQIETREIYEGRCFSSVFLLFHHKHHQSTVLLLVTAPRAPAAARPPPGPPGPATRPPSTASRPRT